MELPRSDDLATGSVSFMLKRISVTHLKPGMYLHELCGSWISHPFWRTSFLVNEQRDIARIVDAGIKEIWIDTDRGNDVDVDRPKEKIDEQIDRELSAMVASAEDSAETATLREEIRRAAKICAEAKQAVISMFQEARMGRAIECNNARKVVSDISTSIMRNPRALISIARLKQADDYTYMHSVAVSGLMISLARQLNLSETLTEEAGIAGLAHDIGKSMIPLSILNKPGKLTDTEFALMKTHSDKGFQILSEAQSVPDSVLDVCLHHHEKADASGYPHRIGSDKLSLQAKMGAVCDVYDAITSDRAYKKGWPPAESLHRMAEWERGHFDHEVFQAFVKAVGIYPPGTLVRLRSDRLGVVVDQLGPSLLAPQVKVFFSIKAKARQLPEIVDLARPGANDEIVGREDPAKWRFPDLEQLWRGSDQAPW